MPGHLGAPMPLEAMGSGAAQLGVATRPPVQHHRATLPLAPPLQWWGAVVLKKVEGKKDAAGRDVFTLRCCCPLGPLPSFRPPCLALGSQGPWLTPRPPGLAAAMTQRRDSSLTSRTCRLWTTVSPAAAPRHLPARPPPSFPQPRGAGVQPSPSLGQQPGPRQPSPPPDRPLTPPPAADSLLEADSEGSDLMPWRKEGDTWEDVPQPKKRRTQPPPESDYEDELDEDEEEAAGEDDDEVGEGWGRRGGEGSGPWQRVHTQGAAGAGELGVAQAGSLQVGCSTHRSVPWYAPAAPAAARVAALPGFLHPPAASLRLLPLHPLGLAG